ncbi:hypothetical protein DRW03_31600 [Corallococcus sp. H22C18031201]|uniref:hypothetical protein n=1 Tax=Citreicoccus inhibens TaxID=2849499 RepID=UPI000E73FA6D|nr:hypothetical protein [Citreicoccus inhibens]MBU8894348.1 hypothetical protein [Citreicoccus inhibens]RJS16182.1 hypothetical protein DRW03_31600 [Corallococcus sp. H22C18031201]
MKRSLALLGILVSLAAGAYVLPGGSILRRTVAARAEKNLSALRVEGSLIFSGPAVKEAGSALGAPTERPELQGDGVLFVKMPGRCRFEATTPDGGGKAAAVLANGRKRAEGPEVPAMTALVAQVCGVLATDLGSAQESREALEQHLASLGVDTKRTSLARFGGEVAYVLGDPDEGRPQFWVYKDTFRAARVRYRDAAGNAWDVRFVDYTSPATGDWMPRTIEVWKGNQRALRFTALKGESRAAVPDKLFTP